ncbi:MAG: DUF2911 domain-containing protein [Bacteroidota bacterium]|nr:DUF2911 domain-containing protein [Ferruginibacter sp.]
MKTFISVLAVSAVLMTSGLQAQDKATRPSPPAKASGTSAKGATIAIDYSQPSVKGRMIGKEIAPYGEVWRTGANEATTFEVNKDVTINGKSLKAGKYGLYSIPGENEWTIIFNKKNNLWGSNGYSEADDALRITAKPEKAASMTEKMTFNVADGGKVKMMWGDVAVDFVVE